MARYSEAHKNASIKYIDEHYDIFRLRFPKGEREQLKQFVQTECSEKGSMNQFILEAIESYKKEIMKNK